MRVFFKKTIFDEKGHSEQQPLVPRKQPRTCALSCGVEVRKPLMIYLFILIAEMFAQQFFLLDSGCCLDVIDYIASHMVNGYYPVCMEDEIGSKLLL